MMIDNKEYSLTYIYGIDIYTHVNNGTCDKNKSDYDVVKEAKYKGICLITKAGPNVQWYLKCPNEYIDNVKQRLLEPFNGKCPKGLYNIMIKLKV